jgi:hypothetical protein
MGDIDYMALQERYGGSFVATRDGDVIASAETFDQLCDQLERAGLDSEGVLVGYVERPDVIRV